jgi:hypothetical protein
MDLHPERPRRVTQASNLQERRARPTFSCLPTNEVGLTQEFAAVAQTLRMPSPAAAADQFLVRLLPKALDRIADHLVHQDGGFREQPKGLVIAASDVSKNIQKKLLTVDLSSFL